MNITYIGVITGLIFFIFKFFEVRFIKKEQLQIKTILRDSIIVCVSVVLGNYIFNQLNSLIIENNNTPNVFTGEPEF
jgi:hypothetical protein